MQERILVYGGTGSGKSYSWLTIARTKPNDTFYCIDTDRAISRMLGTEFKDLKNIKLYACRDWKVCEKALAEIKPMIKEDDWLIVDMADALWDFVQSYYTQEIFHKNIDEYFLQLRKSIAGGSKIEAFKGWTDWQIINKLYQDYINTIMYDLPSNIFITAKASKYSSDDGDEPSLKDAFSMVGFKPEGEKRNAYRVHTVLFLNHDTFGYYITTVKDRGRQQLKQFPYKNFAETYQKVIDDIKITEEVDENTASRTEAIEQEQYKAFGKWLDKNHVRWSEAYQILGITENDKIADYNTARNKIKEAKGILQ